MNEFLTPSVIAEVAAKLVGSDANLSALVSKDLAADFREGSGNVISIRVPGSIAAQTRGIYDKSTPLVSSDLSEQTVDVTLSDHVYDSIILSSGDLDMEIADFATQVLRPQASAITKFVERATATAMSATPETTGISWDALDPARTFTAIRKQLRDNGVDTDTPILAAVGSSVWAALLDGPVGTFDAPGVTRGVAVVESTRLAPDEIVAFVRDAFSVIVRAPAVPDGAPYGASVAAGEFAVRHLRAFDASIAADRSIVSAYVAVSALPLAIDNEDGTVSLVANAGAVRVLTSTIPA